MPRVSIRIGLLATPPYGAQTSTSCTRPWHLGGRGHGRSASGKDSRRPEMLVRQPNASERRRAFRSGTSAWGEHATSVAGFWGLGFAWSIVRTAKPSERYHHQQP